MFSHDGLVVDHTARTVTRDGVEVKLTATEWSILTRSFGTLAGFSLIARSFEKYGVQKGEAHREYLRVYLTYLRKKIERDPSRPRLIVNEPGIGYRLVI